MRNGPGLPNDGFDRIAKLVERQSGREAERRAALEPAIVRLASLEDVDRDFERRPDGTALHRQSHRVWQMRAAPGGGFELIRAQGEQIETDEPEDAELGEQVETLVEKHKQENMPAERRAGLLPSGRIIQAALRGAQHLGQVMDMPAEPPMPQEAQACSCDGGCACDCGCSAGACVCTGGCQCACGCGNFQMAQAPTAPAAPPPTLPTPPMTAGLGDVVETREDKRLAGAIRGTKVLVRIGKRDVLRGKILSKTATHFDVLLSNGATSRVLHQDVALDRGQKAAAFGKMAVEPCEKCGHSFVAHQSYTAYSPYPGTQFGCSDEVNGERCKCNGYKSGDVDFGSGRRQAAGQVKCVDCGKEWYEEKSVGQIRCPDCGGGVDVVARRRQAIDSKAKDYWEAYFGEYGRQLVKSDLPRAVTDRAEPATPAGKQKTPTKSALKVGAVVDIGNIWMADGSKLRTGVVKISAVGDRLTVIDPFGNAAKVPHAAVLALRSPQEFSRRRDGGPANRARLLQAASAALSWEQIDSRYPKVKELVALARRQIARGIRIALAKGAIPAGSTAALLGKAAAQAEWQPKLRRKAIDEKGKSYYRAYWGEYGEELVKEVKRRVRADIIDRAAGRCEPAKRAEVRTARPALPKPAPPRVSQSKREVRIAEVLAAHVNGVLRQAGKPGSFGVHPAAVTVTRDGQKDGIRTLAGKFAGTLRTEGQEVRSTKSFEMIVEAGKVKAVKIG